MEIITRNGNDFELKETDILEFEIETNEQVITNFTITDEQRALIQSGQAFRYDNDITIGDDLIEALEDKEMKINNINKEFKNNIKEQIYSKTINGVKSYYTDEEIKTWDKKVSEAEKVLGGGTSDILLSLSGGDVTVMQGLANAILTKAHEKFLIYVKLESEKNLALSLI